MRVLFVSGVVSLGMAVCTPLSAAAQPLPAGPSAPPAVVVGHKLFVESTVLHERREIHVSMPRTEPGTRVPVLIILDGERSFLPLATIADHLRAASRLPPMLVVGIVNTDRGRDMVPVFEGASFAPHDRPGQFLSFLTDELLPLLDASYPTSGYRILAGHSNAGAFTMQAFIRKPAAFSAYIAISPAAGNSQLQPLLARTLATAGLKPTSIFLGVGDEEADIALGTVRFAKTLESYASGAVSYRYEYFPGESHGSVGMKAYYRALELLAEPDAPTTTSPARYLSEGQRRERAWIRRFGAAYGAGQGMGERTTPRLFASRALFDRLAERGREGLAAYWDDLRGPWADTFTFDATDQQNLLAYLESVGKRDDAAALRQLPAFASRGVAGQVNNYGTTIDLAAGLVSHIVMDHGVKDLASPGATLTIDGATPCPDRHGAAGRAYRFSGQGQAISLTGNTALHGGGSVTVGGWVKAAAADAYVSWFAHTRTVGWGSKWRLGFGTTPNAQWGPTVLSTRWFDYWTSESGLPVGQWVHTAAVFDQTVGVVRLYLNGVLVNEAWGLAPWSASTGPLLLGAQRDDGVFFRGEIGEVRVYARALSGAEVAALARQ